MLTDKHITEHLRATSADFCALEATHHRLDEELQALLKHHTLTPQEEQKKKQVQKEKLGVKDRIAAFIHRYRNEHPETTAP